MKLFRIQFLILSVFIFAGWMAMQQPAASGAQGAQAPSEQTAVTPQKGQTAAEQKQDLAECYDIAKAKTGIDPSALLGLSKKTPGAGEAASATEAASAAAGAAGAGTGSQPAAAPQPESGQAQSSANKAKLDTFEMANQACLKARGYLVKGQAPATAPATEQPKP